MVQETPPYDAINVNDYSPVDSRGRYLFLQALKEGISMPIIHLTYKPGNNKGDLHFVWCGNEDDSVTSLLEQSVIVVEKNPSSIP